MAQVKVEFIGDASSVQKTLSGLRSDSEKTGSTIKGVFTGMQISQHMDRARESVRTFTKDSISAGSDVGESISKVNVVFGDNADTIMKWADGSAKAMGISRQEALESAGTFGNLFSAMGVAIPTATEMSQKIIGLGSDLASFNNANPEEVLLALRSGLVGEAEPLRKFGVNLNAARIEAEAFALGLAKPVKDAPKITAATNAVEAAARKVAEATKKHGKDSIEAKQAIDARTRAEEALEKAMAGQKPELDAAQKAQAAYSIIMKDTSLAQGDFARTSDGMANKSRITRAEFENMQATVGEKLMPAQMKLLDVQSDLIGVFAGLPGPVQGAGLAFANIATTIGPLYPALAGIGPAAGRGIAGLARAGASGAGHMASFAGSAASMAARGAASFGSLALSAAQATGRVLVSLGAMAAQGAVAMGRFAMTMVAGLAKAGAAVGRFTLMLMTNPYFLLIAATIALVVIIVKNWDTITAALGKAWEWIKGAAGAAMEWVKQRFSDMVEFAKFLFLNFTPIGLLIKHFDTLKGAAAAVGNFVKDRFMDFVNFIAGLPQRIANIGATMWDGIVNGFRRAINFLIGGWNALDFGIDVSVPDWVPGVGGKGFKVKDIIPDIPYLAKGGIATGPTLAMVGEVHPERIAPLDDPRWGGGGGVTVQQIGPFYGYNPREAKRFAREVRDELKKVDRRNDGTAVFA